MTTKEDGYYTPDFGKISSAYGLKYRAISCIDDISCILDDFDYPELIEIKLPILTHVYPKLEYGKANQDQIGRAHV